MVCLHGFVDTWRSWQLVLPALQLRHDVLALTLPGHAGGPVIDGEVDELLVAASVECAMDEAGIETAHLVGCSLGATVALQLAARGRARSVVAIAPAAGWAAGDRSFRETLAFFTAMRALMTPAAARAEEIVSTPEGRRQVTEFLTVNFEHLPPDLLAHQMRAAAACEAAVPLLEHAQGEEWGSAATRVECPVRVLWGEENRILRWPSAAVRYREDWLPGADWVLVEGAGHALQMDLPERTTELILELSGGS